MLFDEEIQQDDIEPEDKPIKENVPQDVVELSSQEEGVEIKEKMEEEEDKEKEK